MMQIDPGASDRWRPACDEYFALFSDGFYDEDNQIQFILPSSDMEVDSERGDLVIGRPGVDGIRFCFREHLVGVFAYYPINDEYILVASDVASLVRDWQSGSLKL